MCMAKREATDLVCRYLEDRNNHVLWSVGVDRASEIGELLNRLQAAAIPTKDISGIEAVQVRLACLSMLMTVTNDLEHVTLPGHR